MKLGIMQPYFFPYIGYWQLLNAVDKYVVYDDVNFIKGGWINRNRILVNRKDKMINLKMQGASSNKLINEIEVYSDKVYTKKLLKTIEASYKKAPFFENVFPVISEIINLDESNLAIYLKKHIEIISKFLNIDTEIILSSDLNKDNSLRAEDKVIEICKLLNATEYYNAIGGKELYDYNDFESNGITLRFLDTEKIEYKQFGDKDDFISNLSILDVMMFNSKEDIKIMLDKYKLV